MRGGKPGTPTPAGSIANGRILSRNAKAEQNEDVEWSMAAEIAIYDLKENPLISPPIRARGCSRRPDSIRSLFQLAANPPGAPQIVCISLKLLLNFLAQRSSLDLLKIFRGEILFEPDILVWAGGPPAGAPGNGGYMKKILASIVLFLCATSLALAQNLSSSVVGILV